MADAEHGKIFEAMWTHLRELPLHALIVLSLALASVVATGKAASEHRGTQFLAFSEFETFARMEGSRTGEVVLVSPELRTDEPWTELIVSWNVDAPRGSGMQVEARPLTDTSPSQWFILGRWSSDPAVYPRESVPGQKNAAGEVLTDTLRLNAPAQGVQVRLTLLSTKQATPKLRFLGICVSDRSTNYPALEPNRRAWGKTLPVPEKTQMAYVNGNVLCSPTTVSMLLGYWAKRLKNPDLDVDVPEIVQGIYDSAYHGTGNWSFNMAFAGSLPRMRAYVSRFSDVSELEDWVARGLPVGISVCYDALRGKPLSNNGHLVVCVGFTESGDVIVNDPGTRLNVRKTFARENLVKAWANSGNTVYLVHPERERLPRDRFGHWAGSVKR